jgi:hypothetical protein
MSLGTADLSEVTAAKLHQFGNHWPKAKGHREYGLHCTAELEWLLIVNIVLPARRANLSSDSLKGLLFLHSNWP